MSRDEKLENDPENAVEIVDACVKAKNFHEGGPSRSTFIRSQKSLYLNQREIPFQDH
jgi:hypothetical protein